MLTPLIISILVATGIIAGLMAGLLGIAGGLFMVPVLEAIYRQHGVDPAQGMLIAIGTALACMLISTPASWRAHTKAENVDWPLWWRLFIPCAAGAVAGAFLGTWLGAEGGGPWLHLFFGAMMLLFAVSFWRGEPAHTDNHPLPPRPWPELASVVVGLLSPLLGVGGAVLSIPLMMKAGLPLRRAIGTAAGLTPFVAIPGTIVYLLAPTPQITGLHLIGVIDWAAALVLSATIWFTVPYGTKLLGRANLTLVRRGFAVFLLYVGGKFLVSYWM